MKSANQLEINKRLGCDNTSVHFRGCYQQSGKNTRAAKPRNAAIQVLSPSWERKTNWLQSAALLATKLNSTLINPYALQVGSAASEHDGMRRIYKHSLAIMSQIAWHIKRAKNIRTCLRIINWKTKFSSYEMYSVICIINWA